MTRERAKPFVLVRGGGRNPTSLKISLSVALAMAREPAVVHNGSTLNRCPKDSTGL